ncbi:NAD(P)H-binding protein [Streptococcus danieliae]|uniref:NAD(P)H-binding protein n=1 Tax=Streptococcus danieliae TaxID=747656 RepID=A0A7Z0S4X8_9STRE|nr:NAD(P)H-binding protein [Streptococcus danieliae]MBF0699336.1 NAD(P)H-binding protein [Streptococcus danieliae]NYS96512.1 NAD(P)H-binding protein [Streptococcus danieliae]
MVKIFITGATGRLAHYAIDFLHEFAPDAELFGMVRTDQQVSSLEERGVTARKGDYADKDSLVRAFEGMDRLLFISVPQADLQENVVTAAKEAGISYIAYTSINAIDYDKFGLEINHRATEELIRQSTIAHTFLRNSWYLEINRANIKAAAKTGRFYYTGQGKISHATRKELAEAAARVIATADFPEVVELGRDAYTFADLGQAVQEALEREIEVKEVTADEVAVLLKEVGISEFEQDFSIAMMTYAVAGENGEDQVTATDYERVTGHAFARLSEAVKSILEEDK